MSRISVRRTEMPEWCYLEGKAKSFQRCHLRDFASDRGRAADLQLSDGPLLLDFSKQRVDKAVFDGLVALARAVGLQERIDELMAGAVVNITEGRAALHTALRLPRSETLVHDGRNIVEDVHASLDKMERFVTRIHNKQWRGFSGRAITDVVNIGVGGSDLGPFMTCQALGEFVPESVNDLRVHFVSSIDGTQLADMLGALTPETTLFILSSKSFTTIDTISNAQTAMHWMARGIKDPARILKHHFIGVSASPAKMSQWGIPEDNQLEFWEWVGGRFSLWSAIGLPLALKIGMGNFRQLLQGAHFLDKHFMSVPLERNIPALLGLMGVWNSSFLGIGAHTVLPYDGRLKFFPAYLTQLEMESNGKSVTREGHPVDYSTCPVLWGEVGPNAQHAFYQLLHQGTQNVSCDFIAPVNRYHDLGDKVSKAESAALQKQHALALANCLAQSQVLMLGDSCVSAGADTPAFKMYRGNQPSTTMLIDELSPYTLGMLIALYEHKVFTMSVIWDINPFDQWGVELGKKIADKMLDVIGKYPPEELDSATSQLLEAIRTRKATGGTK